MAACTGCNGEAQRYGTPQRCKPMTGTTDYLARRVHEWMVSAGWSRGRGPRTREPLMETTKDWTKDPDWQLVVAYLHHSGERRNDLPVHVQAEIRLFHADGFGKLRNMAQDDPSVEVEVLVWDWSHVRDSSPEAVKAMADAIRRAVQLQAEMAAEWAAQQAEYELDAYVMARHPQGLVAFPCTRRQAQMMGLEILG